MASNSHHEPLKTLGPADWAQLPHDDLAGFLGGVFADAQLVVDSIPSTTPVWAPARETAPGRARAKTDPAPVPAELPESPPSPPHGKARAASDVVDRLRDEWKEVKVNARDNPLGIRVYKLAGKDGQGSWFARRSVHDRLSFDRWKSGMEREFPETMKVQGSPGSGNIRGIGADKRVEHQVVDGAGHLSVFQLSAQFPGPTAPRDFVTLLLTSDSSTKPSDRANPLRQYMVVSKPCTHPECPPRQGIIRGRYESVEVIREIPSEKLANKRSSSHADLMSDDGRKAGATRPPTDPSTAPDDLPQAIEWLMVTRSDPGGSVPRFMIDKGTPPGIVGDAGKFLDWAASAAAEGESPQDGAAEIENTEAPAVPRALGKGRAEQAAAVTTSDGRAAGQDEGIPSSNGLYGIIAGAFGVASSVANGLRQQLSVPMSLGSGGSQDGLDRDLGKPEHRGDESESDSDTSSSLSFASAVEKSTAGDRAGGSISESNSDESRSQPKHTGERQLQKLIERWRKLEEDFSKTQERLESKRQGEKNKDAAALAKAREKHERELVKQEAKYKREMKKLEDKREQQARKADRRRRKTMEKEERSILSTELECVRAERDVALNKVELLLSQVGELQAQNTMLVAKLGRLGAVGMEDSSSSREASVNSQPRS
ncbi:START-like domain protein [Ophiocordyceps sinensis CO18]|uniref:START-like domain protein n=1 Tax=Ophiocordyceps sinensis (strain Co18 / CGMCC 3.14243) TaxID=911162 RepID=T5AMC1_OPHSC|nr:START-like domain protein [Ophiocordyceps sinensis CO18]